MNAELKRSTGVGVPLALLLLTFASGVIVVRTAQANQTSGGESAAGPAWTDTSFIESPSATCKPLATKSGACSINWDYLYVTAASGSVIVTMTVTIDNRLRAYHAGFFQTAMYIPGDMIPTGYEVSCGMAGSGGKPGWGKSYSFVIRARDSKQLSSANYGTVTCPADVASVYLPFVRGK